MNSAYNLRSKGTNPPTKPNNQEDQPPAASIPMELIDQEHQLPDVIQLLRKETQLSVDCEGVELGRTGELCLVQVATSQKVYLFDVVVLKKKIFDAGKQESY